MCMDMSLFGAHEERRKAGRKERRRREEMKEGRKKGRKVDQVGEI